MTWYIVTDSDWDWNDEIETSPPFIIETDTPEEAIKAAADHFSEKGADGCHMKIAEINTIGFAEFTLEPKVSTIDFIEMKFDKDDFDKKQAEELTLAGRDILSKITTSIEDVIEYDSTRQRLEKIVIDHLGCDRHRITPGASFIDDLGADSLDTVELVMAVEEEFGIQIPDDVAEGIWSFGQALTYIKDRLY